MGDVGAMPETLAIFSDIHANLPALRAVLADMEGQGITGRFCLGDVVGYGGSPAACLELLRDEGIPCLKGNHDAAVTHGNEAGGVIKRMWDWTEKQLDADQRNWLAERPLVFEEPAFQAVHAMLPMPENWNYVLNASDADLHFEFQTRPLCFIGPPSGSKGKAALWTRGSRRKFLPTGSNSPMLAPSGNRVTVTVEPVT